MTDMIELFDMYDVNRKLLGHTHPRGVPIPEGEYQDRWQTRW